MHDKAKEVARGDRQLYYESPVLSRYLPVKVDVVENRVLCDGRSNQRRQFRDVILGWMGTDI